MPKILALLDGSAYSASVCSHAGWAASALDLPVELAHVLGGRPQEQASLPESMGQSARDALAEQLTQLSADHAKLARLRGQAILDDGAAQLQNAGLDVSVALKEGDLVSEIGALSETADLIILGKRGEAADYAKGHLGSNLERVVRSCAKPIVVASRAMATITRAVVAFDGGTSSQKAVEHIARSHAFEGVEVHVLMVGADSVENHRKLDTAADHLASAGRDIDIELVQGDPADEINARVQNGAADLLVMGAYGHSRIRNLIIGSTTTEMIRRCGVTLLLFR